MAFIREYMEEGDPFRFRKPKFLKRLNLGRLKGLGRFAQFIPGPVGTIAGALGDPDDDDDADDYGYSRGYGYLAGDPGRGKKGKAHERSASSGRPKSGGKKSKKNKGRTSAKPHKGGGIGAALAGLDYGKLGQAALGAIPVVGGVAQELAGQLAPGTPMIPGPEPGTAMIPTGDGGALVVPHKGGRTRAPHMAHRKVDTWMVKGSRSMNPTNVHALRRSMRRLEGFQHLVKRVEKMFPKLRHAHGVSARRHGAGCRCKACKG